MLCSWERANMERQERKATPMRCYAYICPPFQRSASLVRTSIKHPMHRMSICAKLHFIRGQMEDGCKAMRNPMRAFAMNTKSTSTDSEPARAAMEGGGFYNRHSAMQAGGIGPPSALSGGRRSQHENRRRTNRHRRLWFVLRDGIQWLPCGLPLRKFAHGQRRIGQYKSSHTDLPSNDFSALFSALEDDPNSYLANTENVFPVCNWSILLPANQ